MVLACIVTDAIWCGRDVMPMY